jgi:hypothetical protein
MMSHQFIGFMKSSLTSLLNPHLSEARSQSMLIWLKISKKESNQPKNIKCEENSSYELNKQYSWLDCLQSEAFHKKW